MKNALAVIATFGLASGVASAISGIEFDDFEGGTTENWAHGAPSPIPPTVESEGSNSFLRIESLGGGGPGSRLAAFNRAQWTGDYLSAGATVVSMDVRNSGNTELFVRLGLRDATGGQAATNDLINLAAGSGWQTVSFNLTDLALFGPSSSSDVLANVTEFRIVSAEIPSFLGDPIVATLDVDNIRVVPTPAGVGVLALGGLAATRRRR